MTMIELLRHTCRAPFRSFTAHAFRSPRVAPRRIISPKAYSTAPRISHPSVATHLYSISGLVFLIVVVGGLTRLTESGLSITEWKPISGVIPPLNEHDWREEFDKYKQSPEGKVNKISIDEFKTIFYWEWGHRVLGRVIGVAFLAPIPYFTARKRLSRKHQVTYASLALLIAGQGALGWYMVKSGLSTEHLAARRDGGVPRVSQYRLAAHLGMAFLVYAISLRTAMSIRSDHLLSPSTSALLRTPTSHRARLAISTLTALIFLTAMSGAFVAGLDAGLLYPTFPYMGETLFPPKSEILNPKYSRKPDESDLILRNVFENPSTVQMDHRILAVTTLVATLALYGWISRGRVAKQVPRAAVRMMGATAGLATLQASLGISTLLYMVPIELAAAHQAGSLALLTAALATGVRLRKPVLTEELEAAEEGVEVEEEVAEEKSR